MKLIYQTILSNTDNSKGNCLQACVASLFDLPLESVPHFAEYDEQTWRIVFTDFIYEKGYVYEGFAPVDIINKHPGYKIVTGISPRGYNHAVIYHNDQLYHDPHPEGGGLVSTTGFFIIKKIEVPLGFNPWRLFLS